jgi:hypothetical protein
VQTRDALRRNQYSHIHTITKEEVRTNFSIGTRANPSHDGLLIFKLDLWQPEKVLAVFLFAAYMSTSLEPEPTAAGASACEISHVQL